jgi:hypothetical protein
MCLNPSQILLVETAGTDSKATDSIKHLKAQNGAAYEPRLSGADAG